jgi:hypothetical protein
VCRQRRPDRRGHAFAMVQPDALGARLQGDDGEPSAGAAGQREPTQDRPLRCPHLSWRVGVTCSSGRSPSAAPAARPLAALPFAVPSRQALPRDSSGALPPLRAFGLSANSKLSWRGPALLSSSPPSLHRLSPASSLLLGDPTSPQASDSRMCYGSPRVSRGGIMVV